MNMLHPILKKLYIMNDHQLPLLSPTLGITKEIMSRGPQVLDMEYREPDQLGHGLGGPILSFV
jgi:hypothetical protein